ncbi:tetratricopeptide repeat protein [Parasphingorhabdus sp.]|uniref:tetratricopeptide repeat protein n=1 Tax=Parasphingorhabdus sp. TaxID=2709688 RepID=UPI003D26FB26
MKTNAKHRRFFSPTSFLLCVASLTLSACADSPSVSNLEQAQKAFGQHEFYEARIHLLNVLESDPQNLQAFLLHARVMLELGDGIAAENSLKKLTEAELSAADKTALTAHSLILQGKADRAIESLENVKQIDRDALVYRMLLWAHLEENSLNDNMPLLDEALELHDNDPDINALVGRFAVNRGDWDIADKRVNAALAADPRNYEALLLAGEIAINQGQLEEALDIYEQAAALYPVHAVPLANIAGLKTDLGHIDDAEVTVNQGLNTHPRYDYLNFQKARIEYLRGNYRDANSALEKMRLNMSHYPPALILSGKIAAKLGNNAFAVSQLTRAKADDRYVAEADQALQDIARTE